MNTGQIVKARSASNYTVVKNNVAQSEILSMKAKGLYMYLMSLPPDWVVYRSELHNHFRDGKDAIRSAFNELEETGLVLSIEMRNDKGQFKGFNYIIYDDFQDLTPIAENPSSVHPPLQKKHNTKETSLKIEEKNQRNVDSIQEDPLLSLNEKKKNPPSSAAPPLKMSEVQVNPDKDKQPEHIRVGYGIYEELRKINPELDIMESKEWFGHVKTWLKKYKYTRDEVSNVFFWAIEDEFWKTVIVDVETFTKSYAKIKHKMTCSKQN